MTRAYDPPEEGAATILAADLAGDRPADLRDRNRIRQLRARITAWVATRPTSATIWRSIEEAPQEKREALVDLLTEVTRDDLGARWLVEQVAPRTGVPAAQRPHYGDFVVAFEAGSGPGRFRARLLETPQGERCCVDLDLSVALGALPTVIGAVESAILTTRDARPVGENQVARVDPRQLGRDLFAALFVGGLRLAWERCMAILDNHPEPGLRIRLLFDLRCTALRTLAALPWELLREPARDRALSKSPRTPIVRSLELTPSPARDFGSGRSEVLLLRSQPNDQATLDLDGETRRIETALRAVPGLHVARAVADLQRFRDLLRSGTYEIVHFMGHGSFVSRSGGALVFEDGEGRSLSVPANALADELADLAPSLVVLASCRGGQLPRSAGAEPFSSVAASLLRAGSPAVIAMQYPISDAAAITFSRILYTRLGIGDSLEAAVAEARLAIPRCHPGSMEWATPVLYLNEGAAVWRQARPRP